MTKRARIADIKENLFDEGGLENHPVDGFIANHQDRIINLNLDQIQPNPEQPRKRFDQEALNNLADSIKTRGLLQPIIVKKISDDQFILVAGERRWRACQLAGLKKIQAVVSSDNELEIALIENMQREDLSAIEEADGLELLAQKFSYTHEQLAKIVNKSRTSITEILSLNNLPEEIKAECRTSDNYPKSVLLQVVRQNNKEEMFALWQKIKNGQFTVRETRKAAKGKKGIAKKTPVRLLIATSTKFIKQVNKLEVENIDTDEKEALATNLALLAEQLQELIVKLR